MIRVLEFADVINRHDFIDTIVRYADPERFEVSVCVRTENHGIAAPEYGPPVKYRLFDGTSRWKVPSTGVKLARLLKEWDIDVLHAHHYDQAIAGWIATKLNPKTKLVIGRHYSDFLYRLAQPKQGIFLAAEQAINRHAARIVVPSRMIFDILTREQGIDAGKIDVVHYGFVPEKYAAIDPQQVAAIREEFGMEGRFVVSNFSRLNEEKGHIYLMQAAAELKRSIPNILILCVGEGPERPRIERMIAELELQKNVKLTGWRKDAMAIMAASDAVVQSTLQEAFSQAMIEALWMRKPLVMTDVSGARDVIRDAENGLLIPKADANALAAAVERLEADRDLGERIAAAGHDFVERELVIERKIGEYERVFEKAVGANGKH